jgi:hypothetical protein
MIANFKTGSLLMPKADDQKTLNEFTMTIGESQYHVYGIFSPGLRLAYKTLFF